MLLMVFGYGYALYACWNGIVLMMVRLVSNIFYTSLLTYNQYSLKTMPNARRSFRQYSSFLFSPFVPPFITRVQAVI